MPVPVSATTLLPPRPTPQSELSYAPARPKHLSPLIDHLGPGYAVVKLVQPPLSVELGRLLLLTLGTAVMVIGVGVAPKFLASIERARGQLVDELLAVVIPTTAVAFFVLFAVAAARQGGAVLKRLKRSPLPGGSITFRRPEALTDAKDAAIVFRVVVHPSPLSRLPGSRGCLRVETTDGRVLDFLKGHSFIALDHLSGDLRKYLLAPPAKMPEAR
jgi:hypothetical protein